MYEKFFSGEAVKVKKALQKKIGSIPARKLLSNIFQVTTHQQDIVEHAYFTQLTTIVLYIVQCTELYYAHL